MTAQPSIEESGDRISCWCCGREAPEAPVVQRGWHQEAGTGAVLRRLGRHLP